MWRSRQLSSILMWSCRQLSSILYGGPDNRTLEKREIQTVFLIVTYKLVTFPTLCESSAYMMI